MRQNKISPWRWMQIRWWLWQHDRRQARLKRKSKPQAPDAKGWYFLWGLIALLFCFILFNLYRAATQPDSYIVVTKCNILT